MSYPYYAYIIKDLAYMVYLVMLIYEAFIYILSFTYSEYNNYMLGVRDIVICRLLHPIGFMSIIYICI